VRPSTIASPEKNLDAGLTFTEFAENSPAFQRWVFNDNFRSSPDRDDRKFLLSRWDSEIK
jgi:hypothetical protein